MYTEIFPHDATVPSGPRTSYYRGFTITVGRIPLDEWSARGRDLYLTTRNTHTAFGAIRTRNPSNPQAANPRLRPCGHRDRQCKRVIARAEPDSTRAENRFRFSPKRTSPFKSVGASVQSTAGSRGVRISLSNAGYTTFGDGVRVLATHSIR